MGQVTSRVRLGLVLSAKGVTVVAANQITDGQGVAGKGLDSTL